MNWKVLNPMNWHRRGELGGVTKIIGIVLGGVISLYILSALITPFLSSISSLNKTIVENGKITGASGLSSLLYLLPFLLVVGAIVVLVYAFMHRTGKGGWG